MLIFSIASRPWFVFVFAASLVSLSAGCGGSGEQSPSGAGGAGATTTAQAGGAAPTGGSVSPGSGTAGVTSAGTGVVTSGTAGAPPSGAGVSTAAGTSGSGMVTPAAGSGGTPMGGASGMGNTGGVLETPEPMATCTGDFEAVSLDGAEYTVNVNSGRSMGDLPHFWNTYGTGHLGLLLREDRGWGQTLKDHLTDAVANLGLTSVREHGLFHDDIGIYREENGTPVYDFTKSDQIFDFLVGLGIAPIIELAPMPSALAADPGATVFDWNMGISVPKDFGLWQELVYQFAQHSLERYGTDVVDQWYWEVWNEPECCSGKFWSGTLEQYYELYDNSAEGVRRALPNARVGGPVASQPVELRDNSRLGEGFLQHVTTDNYVNPGSPGVLGFFTYHSWSFIDGAVNGYFQGLDLLDEYGKNDVSIAITEFGPTYEFGLSDEPQEMDQGAAFVAQTYSDIAQRCARENKRFPITYSWWIVSDIFEEGMYREGDPFIGCMGLTSRENIHKPAYNAYKFLAQMGTQQVSFSVDGQGGVGGMAARSPDGGVQVLIYNAQNPGAGPFDGNYYQVAGPQEIAISVSGLDPEFPYDITAFRVDDTRGNAYATWQSMNRPSMSAMSDSDWQALRDTMDSPAEPLGSAVCGETFNARFTLPSPGVLFIKLEPA